MIKKTDNSWMVDIRPEGRNGRRIRKTFSTKSEALRYERYLLSKAEEKPWEIKKADTRRLSDLVLKWFDLHGIGLKDGEKRKSKLNAICQELNNPLATKFGPAEFAQYRAERKKQGKSDNTANHDLAYLKAVFNELRRLGEWERPNPLELVRKIKTSEKELSYLKKEEIAILLAELHRLKPDAGKIARVCLATGARWSEAENLRAENIRDCVITYGNTKSGKVRAVPISKELASLIGKESGRLFSPSYNTFRAAVNNIELELPAGQLTHILRHTFASHFMQKGGNILTLQKILGHQSLVMTMRYSHMAPDHLEAAVMLNPLAGVDTLWTVDEKAEA